MEFVVICSRYFLKQLAAIEFSCVFNKLIIVRYRNKINFSDLGPNITLFLKIFCSFWRVFPLFRRVKDLYWNFRRCVPTQLLFSDTVEARVMISLFLASFFSPWRVTRYQNCIRFCGFLSSVSIFIHTACFLFFPFLNCDIGHSVRRTPKN